MRSLEAALQEAARSKAAAELEARNAQEAAASDLADARQEAKVLRASAGSARDQALADLKVIADPAEPTSVCITNKWFSTARDSRNL